MHKISPVDNSPVSHNFVHSQPAARLVISGPGRIILHSSPVQSPPLRQPMTKFNQHNSPSPGPSHHQPTKQHQPTTKRAKNSQPTPSQHSQHHFSMNNGNSPRPKVNPIPLKREEFRASQPIPVFGKIEHPQTDVLSEDRFISQTQTDHDSSSSPAFSYASIKHYVHKPEPLFQFTASDNFVDDTENTWQPSIPSPGYVPNVGPHSSEVEQYHSQERISFYPDKHPQFFQPQENDSFNAVKPSVFTSTTTTTSTPPTSTPTIRPLRRKPESSSGLANNRYQASGNLQPKKQVQRKPYQYKKHSFTNPDPSVDSSEDANKDYEFKYNDSRLTHNLNSKIKPVYEEHSDEQLPSKRYGDADAFDSVNEPDVQIYQSVLVSSSLLTSAEHSDNSVMFITPAKPDIFEMETTSTPATTSSTTTTTTESTTRRNVRGRPLRKHTRVFKRKFVAPPSMDSDSCEKTCLSNIVNHEYDPVCGSDDKTYTNVGRLRCTKICGENRKF